MHQINAQKPPHVPIKTSALLFLNLLHATNIDILPVIPIINLNNTVSKFLYWKS